MKQWTGFRKFETGYSGGLRETSRYINAEKNALTT